MRATISELELRFFYEYPFKQLKSIKNTVKASKYFKYVNNTLKVSKNTIKVSKILLSSHKFPYLIKGEPGCMVC